MTEPSTQGSDRFHHALTVHQQAVADFAGTAEQVPAGTWVAPPGDGKWTPAQVCEHLTVTFDVLLGELAGGPGMEILPKRWQLPLLRWTVLPKLLAGEPFPQVRAPREIRPQQEPIETPPQGKAIAAFRERAERFEAAARETHGVNPRQRLSHAYFGLTSLDKAVLLCGRHIQHHSKQLPLS